MGGIGENLFCSRIRLQQGFNFAHAHSGIITMATELQMKVTCRISLSAYHSHNYKVDITKYFVKDCIYRIVKKHKNGSVGRMLTFEL